MNRFNTTGNRPERFDDTLAQNAEMIILPEKMPMKKVVGCMLEFPITSGFLVGAWLYFLIQVLFLKG
jgi:hypothetical protein